VLVNNYLIPWRLAHEQVIPRILVLNDVLYVGINGVAGGRTNFEHSFSSKPRFAPLVGFDGRRPLVGLFGIVSIVNSGIGGLSPGRSSIQ